MTSAKNRDTGAPARLRNWITRAMKLRDGDTVELLTVLIDGGAVIGSWDHETVMSDPDEWASTVSELAQDDANERQTVTSYRVRVVREGAQVGEQALKRTPKEVDMSGIAPEMSLPAILGTIVAQNQNLHKMVLQVVKESHAPLVQVVEMLTRRNAALEGSRAMLADQVSTVREQSRAAEESGAEADKRMMERLEKMAELFGPAFMDWLGSQNGKGN